MEFINVVPATNIVFLETLGPVEYTSNTLIQMKRMDKSQKCVFPKRRLSKPMSNVKDYYATPEAVENEGSDKYTCQIRISESRGEGLSGDTVDLY